MAFRPYFLELAEDYRKGTDSVTESEIAAQAADAKAAANKAVDAVVAPASAPAGADGTREMYDKEYVARLRREAEDHRKKADSLQSEKDATELRTLEANKEFEKIAAYKTAKYEELERTSAAKMEAKDTALKLAHLERVAEKYGLRDMSDLDKMDVASMTIDDRGRLIGVDAAFDDLKLRKPHYFIVEEAPAPAPAPQALADPYSGLRRPPQPSPKPVTGGIDVNALTDAEFDAGWKTLGKFQRA